MTYARVFAISLLSAACSPAPHAEDPAGDASASASTTSPAVEVQSAAPSAVASQDAVVPLEVQEHTLDAKVKSVTPIGAKAGDVFAVDADPRFVVELELMGVAPGMADDPKGSALTAGSTVSFAVHSPAKVFKSDGDMVGKRMHFSVTRTRTPSGVSFGALHVE